LLIGMFLKSVVPMSFIAEDVIAKKSSSRNFPAKSSGLSLAWPAVEELAAEDHAVLMAHRTARAQCRCKSGTNSRSHSAFLGKNAGY
jgi:hypothetical protein